MSSKPSSRPSITESWPKHRGQLTMTLKPSDRISFRPVNDRCNPGIVGAANAGKYCTLIVGHKEIEGLQKIRDYRGLEEFQGLSVEISPQDEVYTCLINSVGVPSSVGVGNAGKEVTIIVHGEEKEE